MSRFLRRAMFSVMALALLAVPVIPGSTSSAEANSTATACGRVIPKGDGTNWNCTFVDNFTGTSLDRSKWTVSLTANSGFHSGPECMVDDPRNIAVANGTLRLTVRKLIKRFTCKNPYGDYATNYTAGSVNTYGKFDQAFGRFEIRARFPTAKVTGLHSAIWLYPRRLTYGSWPLSGEIDIAEYYTKYPDRAIPYMHYIQPAVDPTVTNNYCKIAHPEQFHLYVAEWTPEGITIKYDGQTCVSHVWDPASPLLHSAPFDQPFTVILTQTLGVGQNPFNPNDTPLPATMRVDYVRVWS